MKEWSERYNIAAFEDGLMEPCTKEYGYIPEAGGVQGRESQIESPEKCAALPALWLWPSETPVELLTYRTVI